MLSYDGKDSCLSRKIYSLFGGVDEDKELWLNDFSCVVSCMGSAKGSYICRYAYAPFHCALGSFLPLRNLSAYPV